MCTEYILTIPEYWTALAFVALQIFYSSLFVLLHKKTYRINHEVAQLQRQINLTFMGPCIVYVFFQV
jgi:hypothetical protein